VFLNLLNFILLFFLFSSSFQALAEGKEVIRRPVVAGSFYPDSSKELSSDIKKYLSLVKAESISGRIVTAFVPHAGYIYSGQTAAYPYKILQEKNIKTFIVIGVSHRTPIEKATFFGEQEYETVLGNLKIDQGIVEKLKKSDLFKQELQTYKNENSVDVQLPFIKYIQPSANIVPVFINSENISYLNQIADFLSEILKTEKDTVLVVSTDMSHFHDKASANKMDKNTIDIILSKKYKDLHNNILKGSCELCGGAGAIVGLMVAEKLNADNIKILNYTDSSDATGDKSSVVGYFSGIVFENEKSKNDKMLTKEEEKFLLKIARTSMENAVNGKDIPVVNIDKESILNKNRGAFVTLTKHESLRGCIGYIRAVKPLWKTVSEMSVSAALQDNRFMPVSPVELKDIKIEISVLSELEKIENVRKIEIGKHGIFMQKGFRSGLLLPQVATEYGWNREQFLGHTCLKAGLPEDAWKQGNIDIYIFSAYIFHEE